MGKPTPGPWRVYPVGSCVPHYDVCPRVVSDLPSGRSVSDPIPDEDARLIAAAPDLAAAVVKMLESSGGPAGCNCGACNAGRAALQKAGLR